MKVDQKTYWKSIEELNDFEKSRKKNFNEFPDSVIEAPSKMSRKKFLSIMGASIALVTMSGCRKPVQKIVPYIDQPHGVIPGIPKHYATAMPFGLNSFGVIVENHEGRPTHLIGNKNHPSSLGSTNGFVQASILDLYDPDRSKLIRNNKNRSNWKKFVNMLSTIDKSKTAILSSSFSSPSIFDFKNNLEKEGVFWCCYDPISNENEIHGIQSSLGYEAFAKYDFSKSDCILSIDSDFLNMDINSIRNTKDFSKKRKVRSSKDSMSRLYVVESNLSQTGSVADHRLALSHNKLINFVYNLWDKFQGDNVSDTFIDAVYRDLKKNNGVIKGGMALPKDCHDLIVRMNHVLKSKAVTYTRIKETSACVSNLNHFKKLLKLMGDGAIENLIVFDSNPVYSSKSSDFFISVMKKVKNKIHFGPYFDETAELCDWHIPKAHYLESWGDCQSIDGTVSIIQPMISPLYKESYSDLDFLNAISDPQSSQDLNPMEISYKIIKNRYSSNWNRYLHNGIVKSTTKSKRSKNLEKINTDSKKSTFNGYEVVFYLSGQVYDGKFANNAWLQETPDSVSKVTWDNVAMLSEKTANKLDIKNKEMVSFSYKKKNINVPAWIMPGHADNQISLQVGYGRTFDSRVAKSVGQNVFPLMNGSFVNQSIKIKKTGLFAEIACTQDHHGMNTNDDFANSEIQNRLSDIFRELTLDDYQKNGAYSIQKITKNKHLTMKNGDIKTMYESPYQKFYDAEAKPYNKPYDPQDPPQWGMTIDLNSCTGCNACDIACRSENNIPTVGKEEILKGREMSWVRVDRYFSGSVENPKVAFQPVACVHCENAPCEQVCPVAATVHDKEGINAMVYNRCIGTRYCANNCPYKVRRFNFHNYTKDTPEVVQMAHNPDVTIRFRGVMEKCTYCIQKLKEVEHKSRVTKKNLNEFSVDVACQSACPADCIEFGNIKDSTPGNDIYITKQNDRDYSLLEQLNTRPRTTYLAKIRNTNKEISKS